MREQRYDRYAMFQIRRRISWFAKRLGPCRRLREAIRVAPGPHEVYSALAAFQRGELGPVAADNLPANDPDPANAEVAAA